jgi:hypothetical protein
MPSTRQDILQVKCTIRESIGNMFCHSQIIRVFFVCARVKPDYELADCAPMPENLVWTPEPDFLASMHNRPVQKSGSEGGCLIFNQRYRL